MATTRYLQLEVIDVQIDTQADMVAKMNRNIQRIDGSDHTSGNGKPIPVTAIEFNNALNGNNQSFLNLSSLQLSPISETEVDSIPNGSLYVTGGVLYFKASQTLRYPLGRGSQGEAGDVNLTVSILVDTLSRLSDEQLATVVARAFDGFTAEQRLAIARRLGYDERE